MFCLCLTDKKHLSRLIWLRMVDHQIDPAIASSVRCMLASRQRSFLPFTTTISMLGSFVRATNKVTKNSSRISKMSNKSHPDADLFPHATGLAQKTVEDHQAEQPLKLYAGWFCPFVGRAWTVLQEKNIPYQYIEVSRYYSDSAKPRLIGHQGEPIPQARIAAEAQPTRPGPYTPIRQQASLRKHCHLRIP